MSDPSTWSLDDRLARLDPGLDSHVRTSLQQALRTWREAADVHGAIVHIGRAFDGRNAFLGLIAEQHGHLFGPKEEFWKQIKLLRDKKIVPNQLCTSLDWIRDWRNPGAHLGAEIVKLTQEDVETALKNALRVVEWYYCECPKGPKLTTIYSSGSLVLPVPLSSRPLPARIVSLLEKHHETVLALVRTWLAARGLGGDASLPRHFRRLESRSPAAESVSSLTGLIQERASFILYSNAGSGKSTCFRHLAQELLTPVAIGTPFLVVLVEAPEVLTALHAWLRDHPDADESAFVLQWLQERLREPLGLAETTDLKQLGRFLSEHGLRVVLLFEGFDELISPPGFKSMLKPVVVEQLRKLRQELDLTVAVSSRFGEGEFLGRLDLPGITIEPPGLQEVIAFVARRFPTLAVAPQEVARVFQERLDSRPLYLILYCEYLHDTKAAAARTVGRAALLSKYVWRQLDDNLKRIPWDAKGAAQRRCLRRLAELGRTRECEQDDLEQTARDVVGPEDEAQHMIELVNCLKLFLRQEGSGYRFFHNEFRDYWLADALIQELDGQPTDIDQPLLLDLKVPDVMSLVVELLKGNEVPRRLKKQALQTLLRRLQEPPGTIHKRQRGSGPAAALSLLVRLYPEQVRSGTVDCRNLLLQGLRGAGQRFDGVNFTGTNLRDSDLRGASLERAILHRANLDNVDLRGANLSGADLREAILQNARLGQLHQEPGEALDRHEKPTVLKHARLEGANWFNLRIAHSGYFQLWQARVLPGEKEFLLATSRGALWRMARAGGDPVSLATGHDKDVLGFDVDAAQGWLATASRDATVRFFRFDSASRTLAKEGVRLLRGSSQYFTRVKFGRRWLGIADRAGSVYFLPMKHVAAVQTEHDGVPNVEPYAVHAGPVVCIEAVLGDEDMGERFFTAGYDGVVLCHQEPGRLDERWTEEKVAQLSPVPAKEQEHRHTIRALCIQSSETGQVEGLWLGDEGGRLHFADLASRETHLLDTVPDGTPIFSLARHPGGEQLALGLANGMVRIYQLTSGPLPRIELLQQLPPSPCGDIIRSLYYLDQGQTLLIVSWAGLVHLWSQPESRFVLAFDPGDREWQPAQDTRHLVFGPKNEVSKIRGLSPRYLDYLKRLQ